MHSLDIIIIIKKNLQHCIYPADISRITQGPNWQCVSIRGRHGGPSILPLSTSALISSLSTSRKLCEPRPFMSWKLSNQKIFLLIKKRDHTRQIWACTCWLQISSSSSSEHSSFSLKGVQSLLHEVIALLYLALRVESVMFYSLHI